MVRREHRGPWHQLRIVLSGLRCLVLASDDRGPPGYGSLVPSRRPGLAGGQARLGADDGAQPGCLRGRGGQQPRRPVLHPPRRVGYGAGSAGHARDGNRLRPARLGWRRRDEDHRFHPRRRRRRVLRNLRFQCDHACADDPDCRARDPHRRLRAAHGRPHQLQRSHICARWIAAGGARHSDLCRHRLRAWLGEQRRRLFALAAIGGLIGGAILDIYSSGLALLTLGLRIPRWTAAGLDGVIMIFGTIYVVWIASNFFFPFEGFLITLGVPIAAWCGVFLADLLLRKRDYAEADLYNSRGRYGMFNWVAVLTTVVATFLGWGLVTNGFADWLHWQGYLLNPLGLGPKDNGPWTYANLGVFVALAVGFLGQFILGRSKVARQEST